ncbi:hypothetical protein MHYP_G00080830 [Metynnis hypsauchen]
MCQSRPLQRQPTSALPIQTQCLLTSLGQMFHVLMQALKYSRLSVAESCSDPPQMWPVSPNEEEHALIHQREGRRVVLKETEQECLNRLLEDYRSGRLMEC